MAKTPNPKTNGQANGTLPKERSAAKPNDAITSRMSDIKQSPSQLMDWNKELRKKVRKLPENFDLQEAIGFTKAWMMPVMLSYDEINQLRRDKKHFDVKHVGDAQIGFQKMKRNQLGEFTDKEKKIVLPLPGNTTVGSHIAQNYSSEDALRAVFRDVNWCVLFLIWPMSDDDEEFVKNLQSDEEVQDAIRNRNAMKDEVQQLNVLEATQQAQ